MGMAIGVIAMLLIAAIGAYAVLNDEEDDPTKPNTKLDNYLKDVQSKRTPPRKINDDEITPYQGLSGAKQAQRAQSKKRTQVRRHEASIWDNLAPKEHHMTLNVVMTICFVLALIIVMAVNS